jgi:hypothetical protein
MMYMIIIPMIVVLLVAATCPRAPRYKDEDECPMCGDTERLHREGAGYDFCQNCGYYPLTPKE